MLSSTPGAKLPQFHCLLDLQVVGKQLDRGLCLLLGLLLGQVLGPIWGVFSELWNFASSHGGL